MAKTVGIDLGTTNSVVSVLEGGEPVVISTTEGGRICPSVVAFTKTGERLVGALAKRQSVVNPENTVSSIKRFMGRRYEEVEGERSRVSYKIVRGSNGDARVSIPVLSKEFSPEEISAMILQKLKADAEAYLGEPVTQAVITVPAYFNDAQRTATKNAGEIAGLNVLRIINEPTAASLAYGLDKKAHETIIVWDLGGGTFDVSALDVGEGVFEVLSTNGDTHLGGDDWDDRIVTFLADEFKKQNGIDLRKDAQALQRLREASERAKVELSNVVQTTINLPYITAVDNEPCHLDIAITRSKFEELTRDLVDRMKKPFEQALSDAKIDASKLDEVILVGGGTRMPMVQDLVRKLTNKEPNKSVNPDEVVAVGAAIQAGILGGEVKDIVLLDVTPLSLGVETLGGVTDKLIERNTTIPTRRERTYTTAADGQTEVEVHVLQGERSLARDNKSLGRFHLAGIPPAPRNVPQVQVTFDIDANGIMNVAAKDLGTGRSQSITITGAGTLTKDEIDRMVKEAEAMKDQDEKVKEDAETKNKADSLAYNVEKNLKDLGDKIEGMERDRLQNMVNDLRNAIQSNDMDNVRTLMQQLEQESYKLAEQIYKTTGAGPDGQTDGSGQVPPQDGAEGQQGSSEEVIDAEFKEK